MSEVKKKKKKKVVAALYNCFISRAVHTLPWGTLESEEVEVEVTEPLGKVNSIKVLKLHLKTYHDIHICI